MQLTPFIGVKTLFAKALATNTENGHEYNPMILFKNVSYHKNDDTKHLIEFMASDGKKYLFEKIKNNDVLLRCNCNDFKWRFNFTDYTDHSLYGKLRTKYEAKFRPGSSNPKEMPGMCKHIIKFAKILNNSGILNNNFTLPKN